MKLPLPPDGKGAIYGIAVGGAGKVLHLRGGPSTRFAHIALHRTDLTFANECLRLVLELKDRNTVTAEALWRCALLHYCKCFAPPRATNGRSHLDARRVFNNEPGAMADHAMFLQIRNQQLAHDEGTHNFWSVGAVISPLGESPKVVNVIAAQLEGVSLAEENIAKLKTLVLLCAAWAEAESGRLSNQIAQALHMVPHEELLRQRAANLRHQNAQKTEATK